MVRSIRVTLIKPIIIVKSEQKYSAEPHTRGVPVITPLHQVDAIKPEGVYVTKCAPSEIKIY